MISLIIFLAIGAAAGWLAGNIMKTGNDDLVKNMVLGVVGAFVGGYLIPILGIDLGSLGIIGQIITATGGASLVIFLAGKFLNKSL